MGVSFGHIADVYDETRELPSEVLRKFYEIIEEQIGLDQNLAVLDAGVGTGRTVGPILGRGVELVGVDISTEMLHKMAEKLRNKNQMNQVSLIVGDVAKLPFRACSFDLVLSLQVLHLVENWREAIKDAKRILKPGGVFVVANAGSPFIESNVGQKYEELSEKYGTMKFSKRIIKRIYRNAGSGTFQRFLKKAFDYSGLATSFDYERTELYLKEYGGFVKKKIISWRQAFEVSMILSGLQRRVLSRQWNIPIQTHEKIMSEVKKWVDKKIGTAHCSEEIERTFKIFVARFK